MNNLKPSQHLVKNYENYYEEGDSEWRRLGAIDKVDNIVSLLEDFPRSSILEVGAGEGSVLKRLSDLKFGDALYALELSQSGVDVIKNKGIPRLSDCEIFDGYHIPYEDNKFDIVIMSHVLEHVEYPRALLYEASRVAKYIFVEVPLEDTVRLSHDFVFDQVGHINFYSPKTIRRLVQSCNLSVLGQITMNPSKEIYTFQKGKVGLINYYIKESFIKLFPDIAPKFFAYHGALVCEKKSR